MPKKLPIFYSALLLTGVNLLLRLVGRLFRRWDRQDREDRF